MAFGTQEVPFTLHGRSFDTFDDFREYVLNHRAPKAETIAKLTGEITRFEEKFGMTSEEMAPKFPRGDFEELDNEYEYDLWYGRYQSLNRLNGKGN